MKYKMRSFEKREHGKLPYLDLISEGPIIEIQDSDFQLLDKFLVEFNKLSGDYQIGLEYIEDQKTEDTKDE